MTRKRHSPAETAAKMRQADELLLQGKTQREVAHIIGVSAMTFHRWRKAQSADARTPLAGGDFSPLDGSERISELQRENFQLRKLVTDLLLEKLELEEALRSTGPVPVRARS
jgi:transposase-like protein